MTIYTTQDLEFHFDSILELSYKGYSFIDACRELKLKLKIEKQLSKEQKNELKEARKSAKDGFTDQEYLDGFNYLNGNF